MAKFKVDNFLNTRQFGLHLFFDGNERMAGISIWNILIGVEWNSKEKKPKFSKKKYLNSVKECSEAINRLSQNRYPHQRWGENSEQSEASLNP
jgi:hypothetical protein